jgi:hypothetical protein
MNKETGEVKSFWLSPSTIEKIKIMSKHNEESSSKIVQNLIQDYWYLKAN